MKIMAALNENEKSSGIDFFTVSLLLLILFEFNVGVFCCFLMWRKSAAQKFSVKKVFLQISKNSPRNNCAGVLF